MANGTPWTAEHTALMELMLSIGCSYSLIAQHTGHCRGTVAQRASALGLGGVYGVKYGTWEMLPLPAREAIRKAIGSESEG